MAGIAQTLMKTRCEPCRYREEEHVRGENSQCKGPEARVCLADWRDSKEAITGTYTENCGRTWKEYRTQTQAEGGQRKLPGGGEPSPNINMRLKSRTLRQSGHNAVTRRNYHCATRLCMWGPRCGAWKTIQVWAGMGQRERMRKPLKAAQADLGPNTSM